MKTFYDFAKKNNIICNNCGESNLHWEDDSRGWRLFASDGSQHSCLSEKKERSREENNWQKQGIKWQKRKY